MTKPERASLQDYLAERVQAIDGVLDRWVPEESIEPASIHKAMRYSLFAGGKRIRPILAIAAADSISDAASGVEHAAATLELVHTYSLIHDDLPALDNDDLRRGRPTCHKVFGEAIAILAGDALLTLSFEVLSRIEHVSAAQKIRLVEELARAGGTVGGMIGGQVNDLEGERKNATPALLDSIHRAKTGALLRASARVGAIYAGASEEQLEAISRYGEHIGLAFQIIDDILDVQAPSEALGKTAGKDEAQQKITFPAVYGLERSREMAEEERVAAHAALRMFDDRADRLREIADFIVQRKT
ncbi:MAG: polyprenyl synthetase family protein [Acidobacteriaceae bacterium]|nr:polyprenyl synthetase family protein [Acidobacteriaceae bacterium]MBV9780467.1 polyprenyl synthetase family protein [Acidobacteriaceae bacterium]